MAKINNVYLFVSEEKVSFETEVSSHPVERKADITDHVQKKNPTVSLTGEIVGSNAKKARKKLLGWMNNGTPVNYYGLCSYKDLVIQSFEITGSSEIAGGFSFSATLLQIRVAKTSYAKSGKKKTKKKTHAGSKQVTKGSGKKLYHKVKKGEKAYDLVHKKYKSYGLTVKKLMKNNPKCFKTNSPLSMIVGKKLYIGTK